MSSTIFQDTYEVIRKLEKRVNTLERMIKEQSEGPKECVAQELKKEQAQEARSAGIKDFYASGIIYPTSSGPSVNYVLVSVVADLVDALSYIFYVNKQ